ncbi:MAG: DUF5103 domain-containing protein [Bacteroidales bacterium]|nr:DUF5103 domain-containing protein [Bacteroidales bacterium]
MGFIKNACLFIFLFFTNPLFSQIELQYDNRIYKENIKSILFHQLEKRFSYPIIDLAVQNKLFLEFDDLSQERNDYSYTIIHCNSDWEPSNLNSIEYIEGFEENQVEDFEDSFNTLVFYRHFELLFPNEDVMPKLSGNYILLVYENFDREEIVFSRRFFVVDSKVDIDAEVKRSSVVNTIDDSQELVFTLNDKLQSVFDSQDNLKVIIYQNNIPEINISNIKPDYIKGNLYEYNNPRLLRFKGGNEYRYFNVKNTKYVNDRISTIKYNEPYYIFELVSEKREAFNTYSYAEDINGEMLITADNISDDKLEAEYVYVDFKLQYNNPVVSGKFYVFGALSDWNNDKNNEMYYDYSEQSYKLRMLLKQGFYNYQYVFVNDENKNIDFSYAEGNHYQTENNYVIYVYFRNPANQYDELIGYKIVNSLKRI